MAKQKKTLKDLSAPAEVCPKCQMNIAVTLAGVHSCNCGEWTIDNKGNKVSTVKPLPNYVNTKQIATIEAKYMLSIEEKNQAGNELAHKEKQLQQIEADRKDRMAAFKAQADEVKAQIADLSNKVTLGYEYKKFRCTKDLDFVKKLRIFKDEETGVVIDTRAIEPDDYQLRMPI